MRSSPLGPLGLGALLVATAACPGRSTPSGFSGANARWELPLVGPLEGGLLLTPVTINGIGPYLFALDPDAPHTVIDAQVAKDGKVVVARGPMAYDEVGKKQQTILGEIYQIELGTLIIDRRTAHVVRLGAFDVGGRRVAGIIGHDILGNGLVVSVDRDRGTATLTARSAWRPAAAPAFAIAYADDKLQGELAEGRRPRRVAQAQVNGETFAMHLDLGGVASQLREPLWERAKLVGREVSVGVVDELGSVRRIAKASEPARISVGGATGEGVAFIPYVDRRAADDVDGALGLAALGAYNFTLVPADRQLLLTPRAPVAAAARIARWDVGPLARCPHAGCVTVRVIDPLQGKPPAEGKPHPGVVVSITRDERAGGMDLELVLEGVVGGVARSELPRLIANLPPNVDRHIDHLGPEWVGVELVVVDASPFPRVCQVKAGGCVDQLAR
ncbi:MAG: aspartyl protease family protein [Deltaproteobacteria bacterium]|nr:aspartyl protease family protein [Deltaproteobacteria bacterium]